MTTHQNVTGLMSGRETSRRATWHCGIQLGAAGLCVCAAAQASQVAAARHGSLPRRCAALSISQARRMRVGLRSGRAPKGQERLMGAEGGGDLELGASRPALSIPLGRKEGLGLARPHLYPLLSSVWSISGLPGNFSTSTPHPESKSIRVA